MKRGLSAGVMLLATLVALPVRAGDTAAACTHLGAGRPVRVPLGAADLGVLPEACEATEVTLEGRAAALVATSDFYGSLRTGLTVRGRVEIAERTWLSFWVPGFESRFVANATVEATRVSLGAGAIGAHHRLPLSARVSLAPFARLLLPTETAFEHARRWGGEHGIAAVAQLSPRLEAVFGYAMSLVTTVNGARTLSVLTETASFDLAFRPWRAFAVAGGAALRVVLHDPEPIESVDPRLSLRFYPYGRIIVDLGAMLPLFGRDRTDVALALSAGGAL